MVTAFKVLTLAVVVGQTAMFIGWVVAATQPVGLITQTGELGVSILFLGFWVATLMYFTAGIVWIVWTFRVRRQIAPSDSWNHSKAGLFWWWLCPLANLWMPRRVHRELFSKATESEDQIDISGPLVDSWWTWFIAFILTEAIGGYVASSDAVVTVVLGATAVLSAVAAFKAATLANWVEGRRQVGYPEIGLIP